MKKLMNGVLAFSFLMVSGLALTSMAFNDGEGGRIKVYIVNDCSSDVKYKVASPGSSTHYTADDGTKSPKSFLEGTKIYNSDGKMVHEVSSSSEGEEVVVCD
ncbi:MAG: hypothetical protein WED10_14165 [Brumimicrobium sp.]